MKKKCTALKYYFSISNQNTFKEHHHFSQKWLEVTTGPRSHKGFLACESQA